MGSSSAVVHDAELPGRLPCVCTPDARAAGSADQKRAGSSAVAESSGSEAGSGSLKPLGEDAFVRDTLRFFQLIVPSDGKFMDALLAYVMAHSGQLSEREQLAAAVSVTTGQAAPELATPRLAALRAEALAIACSEEFLRASLRDYVRYAWLCAKHVRCPVAIGPTPHIDLFWHLHQQHPAAYLADCTRMRALSCGQEVGQGASEGAGDGGSSSSGGERKGAASAGVDSKASSSQASSDSGSSSTSSADQKRQPLLVALPAERDASGLVLWDHTPLSDLLEGICPGGRLEQALSLRWLVSEERDGAVAGPLRLQHPPGRQRSVEAEACREGSGSTGC